MDSLKLKRGIRIVLSVLLVLVLVGALFTLAGCGSSNKKEDPAPSEQTAEEVADEAEAPAEVDRAELGKSLLPPWAEVAGATDEIVGAQVFNKETKDIVQWYEDNLSKLGFVNVFSEDELRILGTSDLNQIYFGSVGDQPVQINITDRGFKDDGRKVTRIEITFEDNTP